MLVVTTMQDRVVRPRGLQRTDWRGVLLHGLSFTMIFGLFLAGSGNAFVAAVLGVALMTLLVTASNAKYAMLGEPLVFSDLALLAAVVRHPRFYFTAVSASMRAASAIGALLLLLALASLFVPDPEPHLVGLALIAAASIVLFALRESAMIRDHARTPDLSGDLARYGLTGTLLLYWQRWRVSADPAACAPLVPTLEAENSPDLIVIVQCESFADPVDLTGDATLALPGLGNARSVATQWGNLNVSGFGAYTMRTEYGVLFGRGEAALGFRRYDPFLTAHGETSYALPVRLGHCGYRCVFVHPHDMKFYGRDRLMPAAGFSALIGEEGFAAVTADCRYIDDITVGASLGELIAASDEPTLIYAVTMENHGPWEANRRTGSSGGLEDYLRHLRNSDAMLTGLIDRLSGVGRSALLVFFGDHRPSIPGVTAPDGPRHTPYVMVGFSADGEIRTGANQRIDVAPDLLHHAILRAVRPDPAASAEGAERLSADDCDADSFGQSPRRRGTT